MAENNVNNLMYELAKITPTPGTVTAYFGAVTNIYLKYEELIGAIEKKDSPKEDDILKDLTNSLETSINSFR